MSGPEFQLLDDALSPERVFLSREARKDDLIHFLITRLETCGDVDDVEHLRQAIFARENLMSTGIGLGIGVPHARISSVRRMILAVAVNQTPLEDYESIDGEPVRMVFLVAGRPDQQAAYVRLLAVLSHLVKNPERRNALLAAETPGDLYHALRQSH